MNTRKCARLILLLGLVWQVPALAADLVAEQEPENDRFDTAQIIQPTPNGEGVVIEGEFRPLFPGSTWEFSNDLDFYQVEAQPGDAITATITTSAHAVYIAIFDKAATELNATTGLPDPLMWVLTGGDEPPTVSPISSQGGTYVVGVAPFSWGEFWTVSEDQSMGTIGSYTLALSLKRGNVPILIKPGTVSGTRGKPEHAKGSKPEHAKGTGRVIPVAILSTDNFNAMDVEEHTLTFGETGEELSLVRCNEQGVHMDGNGRADLICFFDASKAKLSAESKLGFLKGKTKDKVEFETSGKIGDRK